MMDPENTIIIIEYKEDPNNTILNDAYEFYILEAYPGGAIGTQDAVRFYRNMYGSPDFSIDWAEYSLLTDEPDWTLLKKPLHER